MSNESDGKHGDPRPHSPPSLDDAELLRYVSKGSSERPSLPPSAQTPIVPSPESLASSITAPAPAAATSASLAHIGEAALPAATLTTASADEDDDSDADDCLPPVNCTADGKLHVKDSLTSPKHRPRINRPVDHAYTDYAIISDDELRRLDQDSSLLTSPTLSPEKRRLLGKLKEMPSKSVGGVTQSFPSKLHQVLANTELTEIISWMPHGRCFVIHQSEVLATEVLPRFFNQTKFLSFIRQLNLWGFKRLTRGVDGKAYYHELFLRGRPYLALRLKRMKIKGHGFKPIPNPTGEPNFYNGFPPVGDTTTIGFASREQKASSPKAKVGGVRTKKQTVMNRTESATINQTNRAGFGGGGLSWDATTDSQWHVPRICNDSILLMPALSKLAPTASILSAGLQSATGDAKKKEDASIANSNSKDPSSVDILALLRSHQLALSATNAQASQISSELTSLAGLKPALVASPFADQLATFVRLRNEGDCLGQRAIPNSRLALLAGLQTSDSTHQGNISGLAAQMATFEGLQHTDGSQIRLKSSASNTGVDLQNAHLSGSCNSNTDQPKIEDRLLADRLSQFRREQEEMALMRSARLYEELASSNNVNMTSLPFSGLQALFNSTDLNLNSNYDQSQPQSYLASGHIPYIPRTTQTQHGAAATSLSSITDPVTLSVTEALREANHLEELALASRARARNIALAGALEVQSRYDAFLKNPLNCQENEGRSGSNIK